MLNISRRVMHVSSQKRVVLLSCRSIYSGRVPQLLSKTTFRDANNDDSKKEGYGEKEICLLGPKDVRTPLPGNTGIPSLSMLYTSKIKELPKPAGENCEVIQNPTPEERYQDYLTQAVCVTAEKTLCSAQLECAAYNCPKLLKEDFLDLFPSRDWRNENLSVITLSQQTKNDMSMWSDSAESEREQLETNFITTSEAICAYLRHFGYWADFIHPNTGKPNYSPVTNATMFETDLRYRNFGFSIEDLGCCKVITHSAWGTHVCTGAIFTSAAVESREVQDILNKNASEISIFSSTEL